MAVEQSQTMPATIAHYGSWQSPLDLQTLFEQPSAPRYPVFYRGRYYWIEARAREGGRLVLIQREPDGSEHCLTPEHFNIRTRVHEYGGKCFVLAHGSVYFSNDSDRRLYVQVLQQGARPVPLTFDSNKSVSYADLQVSPGGNHLIAVMERSVPGAENENTLVAINPRNKTPVEPVSLVQGSDFYACPVVDRVHGRLAWIQWNHPYMPWDQSQLALARIVETETAIAVQDMETIVDDSGKSVCQPGFYQGDLIFSVDSDDVREDCDDFWNLHRYSGRRLNRLTCDLKEYGAPHWVFGETTHVAIDGTSLVAIRTGQFGDELVRVDRASGAQRKIESPLNTFTQLGQGKTDSEIVLVAASGSGAPQLMSFSDNQFVSIKSVPALIPEAEISAAVPISYPTRDGGVAHANYYIPHNTRFSAPDDQLPPLMVMVHGGPTARAAGTLDLARQYWTGIGFTVLDVNHRGSTGYGRSYRQYLLGRWGQVDVDDVIDGVDFLINQALVDSGKVFIRGKSAGGYTVLRALTEYPRHFRAGACYYGIGNLSTLAAVTHKFEANYTDRLIGEEFDRNATGSGSSEFYKRSPVNFMYRLSSPMILFQGLDDPVVPPEVSREVAAMLAAQNIDHEYVEYPGEGHGFRKSKTNIDAMTRETRFYRRILGLVGETGN